MKRLAVIGLQAAALFSLASCVGDVLVQLPVHQVAPGSALSDLSPAMISLAAEVPEGASIGGERTTIGGASLGEVHLAQGAEKTVQLLLAAELEAAGHSLTADGSGLGLTALVETFAAKTDATALYWDVTFDVVVAIQETGSRYEVTATDRTYSNPSQKMITRLAEDCLGQLAAGFRADELLHGYLRGE